jgi:hypothetical protein
LPQWKPLDVYEPPLFGVFLEMNVGETSVSFL